MTTCCSSAKTDGTGKARSALVATPRARSFSDQYLQGMIWSEKNGTPVEELEKSCSRNCLPRLPTLGGMNNEHLQ